MPKKSKTLCVDDLRHAEYYGMQGTFDELYQKSQNGEVFENLMDLILSRITFYLRTEASKRTKAATRQEQTKRTSQILGVKLLMMW